MENMEHRKRDARDRFHKGNRSRPNHDRRAFHSAEPPPAKERESPSMYDGTDNVLGTRFPVLHRNRQSSRSKDDKQQRSKNRIIPITEK